MHIDGACLCGAIRYRGRVDPDRIGICNCTDCQVNSGSAFGVVAHLLAFELTTGTLKTYEKIAEGGNRRTLAFCGDCGTRIYAKNADGSEGTWGLRVGSCNQRNEMMPKFQVWCDSRIPWVPPVQGVPEHARQPQSIASPDTRES